MYKLPIHIALIIDGNGRWAQQRRMPRLYGHKIGTENVIRIIQACTKRGIKVLTIFAFSSENWNRPTLEVSGLMQLFYAAFDEYTEKVLTLNIRIRMIGELSRLGKHLNDKIKELEHLTASKTGLELIIAVGYGGQWDIVEATKKLVRAVLGGQLTVEEITQHHFSQELQLSGLPAPDLCIRTGGECRISNFLLWHLAYSELYFTPTLWPDFNELALDEAIKVYNCRDRRFGALYDKKNL